MNDKKRKAMTEEVIHDLVKGKQDARGEVDANDMAALAMIAGRRMAGKGIVGVTPKEVVMAQRAILDETGADKSLAEKEIILMMERDKARKRRGRR